MGFFDRFKRSSDSGNFKYLDELIHSGKKEIVLDSDIVLARREKKIFPNGINLDVDGLVIDGAGHAIDAQAKSRIFRCTAKDITIKNITLKNGHSNERGGAISVEEGDLTISKSRLVNNASADTGGAIHSSDGNVTITESEFEENESEVGGGALYSSGGIVTITESTLTNNRAEYGGSIGNTGELSLTGCAFTKNSAQVFGGAINNGGRLAITGCSLTGNTAQKKGGAIVTQRGNVIIADSTLAENAAQENGGAVYNSGGKVTITGSALTHNTAQEDGGAINNRTGELTITESELTQNTAKNGGAIHIFEGSLKITDSSFAENRANHGGALDNLKASLKITGSTFTENTSTGSGGAVVNSRTDLTVTGCAFARNAAKNGGAISHFGALLKVTGSTFTENTAQDDGGSISTSSHEVAVSQSEFTGNAAKGNGGAIRIEYDYRYPDIDVSIADSTFEANEAKSGGAVYERGNGLVITDSTFTRNASDKDGGAVSNFQGALKITGSLVEENTVKGDGGAIYTASYKNTIDCTFKANQPEDVFRFRGFDYLGGLTHDGANEIVLDSDITVHDHENPSAIALNVDGMIIDGAGYSIDARGKTRIFSCTGKNITIRNITLKNGRDYNGGAIEIEEGELSIFDSILEGNEATNDGAAIYNHGGTLNVIHCEISSNRSEKSIISNGARYETSNLEFQYTEFHHNQAQCVISNGDNGKSVIIEGEFSKNSVSKSVILNDGKSFTVDKTIFGDELSDERNIINKSSMTLISPEIKDEGKSILNCGQILIKRSPQDLENRICGDGDVETSSIPPVQKSDFSHLDSRIHEGGAREIVLEGDIHLENYELDFYEGGIELDIDGLVIDGNGHAIDGKGKSRIFIITGNDITLKNITFKNGRSYENHNGPLNSNGAAIRNNLNRNISIDSCTFTANTSEDLGGAIHNTGGLSVEESVFHENTAKSGGTISNARGSLKVTRCAFMDNTARTGGAIRNSGGLKILESEFRKNTAQTLGGGGAIMNRKDGELNITDSIFSMNAAKDGNSGAINNIGTLIIEKSKFTGNTAQCQSESRGIGGAIRNSNSLTVVESEFSGNESNYGGAIYNNDGELTVKDSSLSNNLAIKGGALFNRGESNISGSAFNINMADNAGAIYNWGESGLTVTGCEFNGNTANKGHGAITSINNEPTIQNCRFANNKPDDY